MIRSKWIETLKAQDANFELRGKKTICSKHFRPEDFRSSLTITSRCLLKKDAFPTIFSNNKVNNCEYITCNYVIHIVQILNQVQSVDDNCLQELIDGSHNVGSPPSLLSQDASSSRSANNLTAIHHRVHQLENDVRDLQYKNKDLKRKVSVVPEIFYSTRRRVCMNTRIERIVRISVISIPNINCCILYLANRNSPN